MTTQHTPGPWYDFNATDARTGEWHEITETATERVVATLEAETHANQDDWPAEIVRANARLIAVAPDLLAACRRLHRVDRGGAIPWVHNAAVTTDIEALRAICLAFCEVWNKEMLPAIEKATGNT